MKFDFIRAFKEKKTLQTVLVILIAAALMIGCYFFVKSKNQPAAVSAYSETESRLCSILSEIDGVGSIDAYVNESDGKITGVILVFEGADRLSVRLDVLKAASVALGIRQSDITIYKMTR